MAQFLTLGSGSVVTSGLTIAKADPLTILVPSMVAAGWTLEFGVSVTDSAGFAPLTKPDGSGGVFAIFSGAGGAVAGPITPPTSALRIRSTTSATAVATLTILPVAMPA